MEDTTQALGALDINVEPLANLDGNARVREKRTIAVSRVAARPCQLFLFDLPLQQCGQEGP
jgi:hypothetical protein